MIQVDISKCTGCRRCEVACAFYHTGRISRHLSRIKVLNLYEMGIDGAVVCAQCQERYCQRCPHNAMQLGPLGQIIVSPTTCQLCGACQKSCPIGAVEIFEEIARVCDLCAGRPKCVETCSEGALSLAVPQGHLSLAERKKETKGMNPSQKRQLHLAQLGAPIRKKWSSHA